MGGMGMKLVLLQQCTAIRERTRTTDSEMDRWMISWTRPSFSPLLTHDIAAISTLSPLPNHSSLSFNRY